MPTFEHCPTVEKFNDVADMDITWYGVYDYGYAEEHVQSVGIEGAADANKSLRRHHHGFVYCRRTDFICSSSAPLLYSSQPCSSLNSLLFCLELCFFCDEFPWHTFSGRGKRYPISAGSSMLYPNSGVLSLFIGVVKLVTIDAATLQQPLSRKSRFKRLASTLRRAPLLIARQARPLSIFHAPPFPLQCSIQTEIKRKMPTKITIWGLKRRVSDNACFKTE